jgi:hypothetical protein
MGGDDARKKTRDRIRRLREMTASRGCIDAEALSAATTAARLYPFSLTIQGLLQDLPKEEALQVLLVTMSLTIELATEADPDVMDALIDEIAGELRNLAAVDSPGSIRSLFG